MFPMLKSFNPKLEIRFPERVQSIAGFPPNAPAPPPPVIDVDFLERMYGDDETTGLLIQHFKTEASNCGDDKRLEIVVNEKPVHTMFGRCVPE